MSKAKAIREEINNTDSYSNSKFEVKAEKKNSKEIVKNPNQKNFLLRYKIIIIVSLISIIILAVILYFVLTHLLKKKKISMKKIIYHKPHLLFLILNPVLMNLEI